MTSEYRHPSTLHVALVEPEIPPNTGNIARLCLATYTPLHLVGRLGFRTDDKAVQRAGLDYWHETDIRYHRDLTALGQRRVERRQVAVIANVRFVPVIEPGALHRFVVSPKAESADQVQGRVSRQTEPRDVAGVRRYLRLHERDVQC